MEREWPLVSSNDLWTLPCEKEKQSVYFVHIFFVAMSLATIRRVIYE